MPCGPLVRRAVKWAAQAVHLHRASTSAMEETMSELLRSSTSGTQNGTSPTLNLGQGLSSSSEGAGQESTGNGKARGLPGCRTPFTRPQALEQLPRHHPRPLQASLASPSFPPRGRGTEEGPGQKHPGYRRWRWFRWRHRHHRQPAAETPQADASSARSDHRTECPAPSGSEGQGSRLVLSPRASPIATARIGEPGPRTPGSHPFRLLRPRPKAARTKGKAQPTRGRARAKAKSTPSRTGRPASGMIPSSGDRLATRGRQARSCGFVADGIAGGGLHRRAVAGPRASRKPSQIHRGHLRPPLGRPQV